MIAETLTGRPSRAEKTATPVLRAGFTDVLVCWRVKEREHVMRWWLQRELTG
jgi:hypothetical protein